MGPNTLPIKVYMTQRLAPKILVPFFVFIFLYSLWSRFRKYDGGSQNFTKFQTSDRSSGDSIGRKESPLQRKPRLNGLQSKTSVQSTLRIAFRRVTFSTGTVENLENHFVIFWTIYGSQKVNCASIQNTVRSRLAQMALNLEMNYVRGLNQRFRIEIDTAWRICLARPRQRNKKSRQF